MCPDNVNNVFRVLGLPLLHCLLWPWIYVLYRIWVIHLYFAFNNDCATWFVLFTRINFQLSLGFDLFKSEQKKNEFKHAPFLLLSCVLSFSYRTSYLHGLPRYYKINIVHIVSMFYLRIAISLCFQGTVIKMVTWRNIS